MDEKDRYIANKTLNEQEIEKGEIVLKSKPRELMIILTSRCNLNCIMCPREDHDYALPYEVFEKISYLYPYLELINWGGGEVFQIDYFKKLFRRASSYPQIRQSITTNGLLIDEEWAELLVKNNVHLTYSIDGLTREIYEYVRKGARFDQVIENIEAINKKRRRHNSQIELMINVVVMKSNYRQLHLFPEFCRRYNFQHLRFEYQRPVVVPEEDIFTARKDSDAIGYLRDIMPKVKNECEVSGIKLESCIEPFLNHRSDYLTDSKSLILNCRIPWRKLLIDGGSNGKITPDCLCTRQLGNILDDNIEDVWNNEIMQQYRKNILGRTTDDWCAEACLTYER